MNIDALLEDYMKNPKWAGKIFMQDEKTCYIDGLIAGAKAMQEENEQLKGCNTDLKQSLDLANERETEWANRIEGLKTDLEYAKAIIKDLLDNSHEYARQNAEDFIKGEKK